MEKESCDPFCSDSFLHGTKDHPLSKPMVNHDQKRIKAIRRWEVCDEVTGDLLKWVRGDRVDGSKRGSGGICVGFVLLTNGTTITYLQTDGARLGH